MVPGHAPGEAGGSPAAVAVAGPATAGSVTAVVAADTVAASAAHRAAGAGAAVVGAAGAAAEAGFASDDAVEGEGTCEPWSEPEAGMRSVVGVTLNASEPGAAHVGAEEGSSEGAMPASVLPCRPAFDARAPVAEGKDMARQAVACRGSCFAGSAGCRSRAVAYRHNR